MIEPCIKNGQFEQAGKLRYRTGQLAVLDHKRGQIRQAGERRNRTGQLIVLNVKDG
jgi:hypothetical protein